MKKYKSVLRQGRSKKKVEDNYKGCFLSGLCLLVIIIIIIIVNL